MKLGVGFGGCGSLAAALASDGEVEFIVWCMDFALVL